MIDIVEATAVDDELVAALERLVRQLTSSTPPPTRAQLEGICRSPATVLLVARDADRGGNIVGSLTLVLFRIPTGMRAWIEDVVVDSDARRTGVGRALSQEAVSRAAAAGARTVDLTSRPSREAANRLYRRLGFQKRDTNVYRYSPD